MSYLPPCAPRPKATMRATAWIWFLGCGAWFADGLVNAHYRLWPHAKLAFTVSLFFLAAGLFYSQQKRR